MTPEEFFFSDGIKITLIIIPYKISEDETNNTTRQFCVLCEQELFKWKSNNYNVVSHNLLECLQRMNSNIKYGS